MPLIDLHTKKTWDYLYDVQVNGQRVNYTREAKLYIYGVDIWHLARVALKLEAGQRICIIGGGFGWGAEELEALGLGPIVVTDTSAWIHSNKANLVHEGLPEAVYEILNEDCLTMESRARVLAALGGGCDVVITEDVLPVLTDAECLDLCVAVRQLAPKVVHWVSVKHEGNFASLNWKTPEEWKALVQPDIVVQRGRGVAL